MADYTYLNGTVAQQTPYKVFGYIALKTEFTDGSHIVADWPEDRKWWNYLTKGSMINFAINESSTSPLRTLPDYVQGDWYGPDLTPQWYGVGSYDVVGETVLWCFSDDLNNDYVPDVEKWFLAAGQTVNLPVGTKLFMCQGNLLIDGSTKTNPTQIHIKTNETSVVANEDCYGFLFV